MSRPSAHLAVALAFCAFTMMLPAQEAPRVLATFPADLATGLPHDIGRIEVVFDRPMRTDQQSVVRVEGAEVPALRGSGRWRNERTFVLDLGPLPPGRRLGIAFNDASHLGFASREGVPLAPTPLRFESAPEGAAVAPVVVATEPEGGALAVDPALGRVVVAFSADMAPRGMSLVRLAGVEKLGYQAEAPPFFETPRRLVIPVALTGGVTYGVGINGPAKSGFASPDGVPAVPFALIFSTATAAAPAAPGGPAPAATRAGLAGRWVAREGGTEIALTLDAGGRYTYREQGQDGLDETHGRWSATGDVLEVQEDGERAPLRLPYRTVGEGRLEVTLEGMKVTFVREEAAAPAVPPCPAPGAAPAPAAGPAAAASAITGSWTFRSGGEEIALTLGADGRYAYRYRGPDGAEDAAGRWTLSGTVLEVREDGAGEPLRVPCERLAADRIALTIEGRRCVFERAATPPGGAGPLPPAVAAGPGAPKARARSSVLLYTKYETVLPGTPGLSDAVVEPRIWTMYDDGSEPESLVRSGAGGIWQDPFFVPDGRTYVMASDWDAAGSALLMDIYEVSTTGDRVERITGNVDAPAATGGFGSIVANVVDDTQFEEGLTGKISWQGMIGNYASLGERGFRIDNVPAGTIWLRYTASKHIGDLAIVTVPAGGEAKVTLQLTNGNHLASYPSLTPDRRYLVCLSQRAYYDPKKARGKHDPSLPLSELNKKKAPGEAGFDTIAVIDRRNPARPAALWDPTRLGGQLAKDPRLSFDGRWIAFAMGTPPMESVAVMSLEGFLSGRPDVKVVAPGARQLGVAMVGHAHPAWSRDGRRLAFVRVTTGTQGFTGDVYVVDLDGGAPRPVTRLQTNQCAGYPTWSPDGTRVAFSIVTSKRPVLDITDLLLSNITSDVWLVGIDGQGLQRLTRDGVSSQPCWGP